MAIRQIRHRPDSGKQFVVEVADGKLEKAAGPLDLEPTPAPEKVLDAITADFAPDPGALAEVRDAPAPAKADYELDERGRLLDVRKSAPAPVAVVKTPPQIGAVPRERAPDAERGTDRPDAPGGDADGGEPYEVTTQP
jgi:hypothetical protein